MKQVLELIILVSSTAVFGQSVYTKYADEHFEKLAFIKAGKLYEKAMKKDSSSFVLQRLGDCYYLNSQMEEASKWYGKMFTDYSRDSLDSEYYFKYAQALRATGKTKDSDKWIELFTKRRKEDSRGKNFTSTDNEFKNLNPLKPLFKVKNVEGLNSERSEYGVSFVKNGIIYSSLRPEMNLVKRKHAWNNKAFSDLYFAKLEDGKVVSTSAIKNLNSKFHEAVTSLSPDGKTIYFTRNDDDPKRRRKGEAHLKIYQADWIDGEWKNVRGVSINSSEYSVAHPAVNSDGTRLYFVSDMPGSLGKTDVFYVRIKEDGALGPVEVLGSEVNTEGKELFPYVEDETLYFSSDGFYGLGGLDIFKSTQSNGKFSFPENLKAPINSRFDDFAFALNPKTNTGYFSSNRKEGVGDDDIYTYVYDESFCSQPVVGVVKDKHTQKLLAGATVKIYNELDEVISETVVGSDATFNLEASCFTNYKVVAQKEFYGMDSLPIAIADYKENTEPYVLFLERDAIDAELIYFDLDKDVITPEAAFKLDGVVEIMNKYSSLTIEASSYADSRATNTYNQDLSERRSASVKAYLISKGIDESRVKVRGFGESDLVNKCSDGVKCSEEEHRLNRRTEIRFIYN